MKHTGVLLTFALLVASAMRADNVTGVQKLLCTPIQTTVCSSEGECSAATPAALNIPQFIEVDLEGRVLRTTAASEENRSTQIRTLIREDGLIIVQGVEAERAFSFVISEIDGVASIAVARDGVTVSAFGACTPLVGGEG